MQYFSYSEIMKIKISFLSFRNANLLKNGPVYASNAVWERISLKMDESRVEDADNGEDLKMLSEWKREERKKGSVRKLTVEKPHNCARKP